MPLTPVFTSTGLATGLGGKGSTIFPAAAGSGFLGGVAKDVFGNALSSALQGGDGQAPQVPPLAQGLGAQPQRGPDDPGVAELLPTGPSGPPGVGLLSPILAADPMFARGPPMAPRLNFPGMTAGPGGTSKAQALLRALLG